MSFTAWKAENIAYNHYRDYERTDMFSALAITNTNIGHTLLIYAVGIIAMIVSVIAFQFKHRISIVLCNFLGQACWVLYFLLQSDFTSAVAGALSAAMIAVFAMKDKWKWATSNICVVVFSVIITVFSIATFATWVDVFPLLAGVFAIITNSRTEEKRIRQFALLWCGFWLINSILKVYTVAILNDLFMTASAAISLYRYREKD